MAANKIIRLGPVALTTTTTTNIINTGTNAGKSVPPVGYTDPLEYIIIRHIRVTNKATSSVAFGLWLGATGANAAGTEVISGAQATAGALTAGTGVIVPAQTVFDWYGLLRLDSADFLVGGASAATALTFEAEGEVGLA